MPVLVLKFKDKIIDKFVIDKNQTITIGRKETNDVVINNLGVSGTHARIDSVSATFILTDLQSTNGTFVNRKLISAHNLRNQDVIIIGKHHLIFDSTDMEIEFDPNSGQSPEDSDNEDKFDKTRYLDTEEYRDLIENAKGEQRKPEK